MKNNTILVTTSPFSQASKFPRQCLLEAGFEVVENPYGRRLQLGEIGQLIKSYNPIGIIAGTEPITEQDMKQGSNLKIIARVGIGLDSLDLNAAADNGITVTFTPDAPAPAVAELALGQMISLLRGTHILDNSIRSGQWERRYGRRLSDVEIGVIGVGRIGARVIRRILPFGKTVFRANDLNVNHDIDRLASISWETKEDIYKNSDIISIHVPLTKKTMNMIGKKEFALMKSDVILINTSRGGIVDEGALYDFLVANPNASAAIDVFVNEPYNSPFSKDLCELNNVILTPHLGSMTRDCRTRMETEAVESVVSLLRENAVIRRVPQTEYEIQREFLHGK